MIEINSYYAKTHQGPYLNINEDDILVDLENRIFMVMDGFGGGTVGTEGVKIFKDKVSSFFTKVSSDPDATMPHFYNPNYLLETNAIVNAIELGHRKLIDINKTRSMSERAGLSCLCAILSENIASIVSVGNCLSLLYRMGKVSLISAPDIIVPVGFLENNLNNKTFPLTSVGMYQNLMPKIWEVGLRRDDKLILLTDGVYSKLSLEDIKSIIESSKDDEQLMVKKMSNLASERGNLDNQSVIVVSI